MVAKAMVFQVAGGLVLCLILVGVLVQQLHGQNNQLARDLDKQRWQGKELSVEKLGRIARGVDIDRLMQNLQPILIPRPPGSTNISVVAAHFVHHLKNLGQWKLTHDSFNDKPPDPYPIIEFRSLIATYNPSASRRLVLACHHDSKITPRGFLGATDSAVPCAMMIEIAYVLNDYLRTLKAKQLTADRTVPDITLQLLFLDGEEAFVSWTATDSLYGARNLARKWQRTDKLSSIDLFVLLDLIGTSDTTFRDFTHTYTRWFSHAHRIEQRMTSANLLPRIHKKIFESHQHYNQMRIEDDHIPFHDRGVPVMHLISVPFPRVWHTMGDNGEALDRARIHQITRIVAVFVAEYLHLDPLMNA